MGYLYFTISSLSVILYFISIKIFRLRLVSFSTVNYVVAFFVAILPGYNIALGNFYNGRYSHGFDIDVYMIYLLSAVLLPISLIIGNLAGKNIYLYSLARKNINSKITITLFVSILYAIFYFLWLPYIPLNSIISGTFNFMEVAIQRIAITHQLGSSESLPVVFRYWRNIIQVLPFIVFIYFLLKKEIQKTKTNLLLLLLFILLSYFLSFTLEKAQFVYAIMAIYLLKATLRNKIDYKKIFLAVAVIIASMMLLIHLFMGAETVSDMFEAMLFRLTEQTCSTYVQLDYVRQEGIILFRGIYLPLIGNWLSPGYFIDLSQWAFGVFFPSSLDDNMVGSTGGLALAELYCMFSWFAIPLFIILTSLYGYIDAVFSNSFEVETLPLDSRIINITFYVFMSTWFALGLTGSVLLFINPAVLIIVSFYFIYVKISSVRLKYLPGTSLKKRVSILTS